MRRLFVGLAFFALTVPVPLVVHANDREIARQIVTRLQEEQEKGNLQGFNIDLHIDQGAVHLKGHVSGKAQRQLAIDIARRVEGVKKVLNEIEIAPAETSATLAPVEELISTGSAPVAPQPEETEILLIPGAKTEPAAKKVASSTRVNIEDIALDSRNAQEIAEEIIGSFREEQEQGNLRDFGIDVQVEQGTVWLKGHVASHQQEELALDIARCTRGVTQVVNALEINSSDGGVQHAFRQDQDLPATQLASEKPASSEIAQEVVRRLTEQKQQGNLRNFGIDVQVDQRIVWLSGYVDSQQQLMVALDQARFVPGVEKVVNDLTVGQPTTTASHQLAANQTLGMPQQAATQAAPGQAAPGQLQYTLVPIQYVPVQQTAANVNQTPLAFAPARPVNHTTMQPGQPVPMGGGGAVGIAPARFDHPQMPGHAWPSYAAYPNYGAVTYPKQYSASAWPYIGPFYPYPQVPLGWRRVTLEWDDGWWNLKFKNHKLH